MKLGQLVEVFQLCVQCYTFFKVGVFSILQSLLTQLQASLWIGIPEDRTLIDFFDNACGVNPCYG